MNKFSRLPLLFITVAFLSSGCMKNEADPMNSKDHDFSQLQKSTYSDIELLGMAANIDEIQYSNGLYEVSFYGSTSSFTVNVGTFQADSIIQIEISDGTHTFEALIDFDSETLDIENDRVYSFRDLNDGRITSSSSLLLRVVTGVVAQHIENPKSSISFIDNGSADYFPDEEVPSYGCCICSSTVTNEFFPGLCIDYTTTTIFWIFEVKTESDPYPC